MLSVNIAASAADSRASRHGICGFRRGSRQKRQTGEQRPLARGEIRRKRAGYMRNGALIQAGSQNDGLRLIVDGARNTRSLKF